MKFSDTLHNPHFNNLAAIIRVAFLSSFWKSQHPEVPVWTLLKDFDKVTSSKQEHLNRVEVLERFTNLIVSIANADQRLRTSYTEVDMAWFVGVLDDDDDNALTTLNMLKAWYSAPDHLLTPVEVAEATGTAESTWRNRAAAGDIPGAVKKGKQWLLPWSVLRSQGIFPEGWGPNRAIEQDTLSDE